MAIEKVDSGHRRVAVEIDVSGSPERVWEAIATGPGISSWFVPTEFETDASGTPVRVVSHFGPGNSMDSVAEIVSWDPPHRFQATSADLGPDAPEIATEWIVEAHAGGTCTVRVVHSLFTDSDGWDNQLEAWEQGWPWFFQILRLYLHEFGGQPGAAFRVMGASPEHAGEVWETITALAGLGDATEGSHCASPEGMPPLRGQIRKTGSREGDYAALVLLEAPAPGILSAFAMPMGGRVYLILDFFLFGADPAAAVAQAETPWQHWMAEKFPMPEDVAPEG